MLSSAFRPNLRMCIQHCNNSYFCSVDFLLELFSDWHSFGNTQLCSIATRRVAQRFHLFKLSGAYHKALISSGAKIVKTDNKIIWKHATAMLSSKNPMTKKMMNDLYIMIHANVEKVSKRHNFSFYSLFQYIQCKSVSVSH